MHQLTHYYDHVILLRSIALFCRSQQPRGIRHELSSLVRTLGLWVRIPLKPWVFGVCVCVYVFFCVYVALCLGTGLATAGNSSKESYRL
jgi:hypothetical protein